MSISLADALQEVNREVGRVYQCRVGEFFVEVRVAARGFGPLPTPIEASDVMLDPWTDFPFPSPQHIIVAIPAGPVRPDVPSIPCNHDDVVTRLAATVQFTDGRGG